MANLILFYAGWWACALMAMQGYGWLAPPVTLLCALIYLWLSPLGRRETPFLAALGCFGFLFDTALMQVGLFETADGGRIAPGWLVAMWVLFAFCFEGMLAFRRRSWVLPALAAAVGPFSYVSGEALGLIHYARPLTLVTPVHGLIWAVAILFLFKLREYLLTANRPSPQTAR